MWLQQCLAQLYAIMCYFRPRPPAWSCWMRWGPTQRWPLRWPPTRYICVHKISAPQGSVLRCMAAASPPLLGQALHVRTVGGCVLACTSGQLAAMTGPRPPNLSFASGVGWRLARRVDRPAAHRGTAAGRSAGRMPALAAPGQLLPGLCAADVRPGALAAHGTSAAGGRRGPHDCTLSCRS